MPDVMEQAQVRADQAHGAVLPGPVGVPVLAVSGPGRPAAGPDGVPAGPGS
jgi:hypothetical protein